MTDQTLTEIYFPDCNMREFVNDGAEYTDDPNEERMTKIRDMITEIHDELDNLNGTCSELKELIYDKQDLRAVETVARHIADAMWILEDLQ